MRRKKSKGGSFLRTKSVPMFSRVCEELDSMSRDSNEIMNYSGSYNAARVYWDQYWEGNLIRVCLEARLHFSLDWRNITNTGIYLTICKSPGPNLMSMSRPEDIEIYIHIPTAGGMSNTILPEFASMVNKSRVGGLSEIGFPKNWCLASEPIDRLDSETLDVSL